MGKVGGLKEICLATDAKKRKQSNDLIIKRPTVLQKSFVKNKDKSKRENLQ
jgi:hypothetical protein